MFALAFPLPRFLLLQAFLLVLAFPLHGQIDIEVVPVGNPGNPSDPLNDAIYPGIGSVDYDFYIGTYEVTNAQYAAFLNEAAASDTVGLYDRNMAITNQGGIVRNGDMGSFTYTIKPGMECMPVAYVSFMDAVRFANYLTSGDINTGVYDWGGTPQPPNQVIVRDQQAWEAGGWALPTQSEWHKAAYHQPASEGGDTDHYWLYPTVTNDPPSNTLAFPDPGNTANFYDITFAIDSVERLTDVGTFSNSPGPYGTYDQGGNLMEWTETIGNSGNRIIRGGDWGGNRSLMQSSWFFQQSHSNSETGIVGFRLVRRTPPPEPGPEPDWSFRLTTGLARAEAVSDDGMIVTGRNMRWTPVCGAVQLGELPGGSSNSMALAISGDGFTIAGETTDPSDTVGMRWNPGLGMQSIGELPGGLVDATATGVSHDGSVITGYSFTGNGNRAFRWTADIGMIDLGGFPGANPSPSLGWGISDDGSVIVGGGRNINGENEAFRWTEDGGMVGLGDLPGGTNFSSAENVSGDGNWVVGFSQANSGREAFRWSQATGMTGLGDLAGGSYYSWARDVSDNGYIVVGESNSSTSADAFIWDEGNGMRSLKSVLENEGGIDLSGFRLLDARAISADGRYIVGRALSLTTGSQTGYLARIVPPSPAPPPTPPQTFQRSATSLAITWPSNSPGWILEESPSLDTGNWTNVDPSEIEDDSTNRSYDLSFGNRQGFVRLRYIGP